MEVEDVAGVAAFEREMLKHFRDELPELLSELLETGELSDELTGKLSKAIGNFKTHYSPEEAG